MGKITNVMIKDHNTLIINQEAHPGDEIDLLSINQIDNSILIKAIKEGNDKEYNRLLTEAKKSLHNELEREFVEKVKFYEIELEKLKERQKQSEKENEIKVKLAVNIKEKELQEKINDLESKLSLFEKAKELEIVNKLAEYKDKIADLEVSSKLELAKVKNEYEAKLNQKDLDKANMEVEFTKELQEKESQINKLTLSKSSLSIKRIGENLEHWCNNEYLDHAQMGFSNCTWIKDNTSIKDEGEKKGTKADYIFRVYATEDCLEKDELSSVCCEMKSEDPQSVVKKKNSDHYAKLDKDREKKKCKYALLISELEWDQENDVPIRKVSGYQNMYVVRPQYFITFLSIIASLTLKFKALYLEKAQEMAKFKDSEDILKEFEEMKATLLDKPLKSMENELAKITDSATKIKLQADKIMESTEKIAASHIVSIRSKIEGFAIKKIIKKIDKLN